MELWPGPMSFPGTVRHTPGAPEASLGQGPLAVVIAKRRSIDRKRTIEGIGDALPRVLIRTLRCTARRHADVVRFVTPPHGIVQIKGPILIANFRRPVIIAVFRRQRRKSLCYRRPGSKIRRPEDLK